MLVVTFCSCSRKITVSVTPEDQDRVQPVVHQVKTLELRVRDSSDNEVLYQKTQVNGLIRGQSLEFGEITQVKSGNSIWEVEAKDENSRVLLKGQVKADVDIDEQVVVPLSRQRPQSEFYSSLQFTNEGLNYNVSFDEVSKWIKKNKACFPIPAFEVFLPKTPMIVFHDFLPGLLVDIESGIQKEGMAFEVWTRKQVMADSSYQVVIPVSEEYFEKPFHLEQEDFTIRVIHPDSNSSQCFQLHSSPKLGVIQIDYGKEPNFSTNSMLGAPIGHVRLFNSNPYPIEVQITGELEGLSGKIHYRFDTNDALALGERSHDQTVISQEKKIGPKQSLSLYVLGIEVASNPWPNKGYVRENIHMKWGFRVKTPWGRQEVFNGNSSF